MSVPWLTVTELVPLVGAAVVALLPKRPGSAVTKQVAFGFSLVALVLAAIIGVLFDVGGARFQFVEQHEWIAAFGGMSQTFRRVQTGFVRSYALSVLAGALLVVLALLAVNLA